MTVRLQFIDERRSGSMCFGIEVFTDRITLGYKGIYINFGHRIYGIEW